MRRSLIALTSSALVACGWSLSGYSGGDDATSAGDAAVDASAADAPAASDATSLDGGHAPCRDRPLSKTLLFCDDFDDPGEQIGQKWTLPPAGTVSGSPTRTLSPPTSMQAKHPVLVDTYGYAHLRTGVTVAGARAVTYRFAMYVESLGAVPGDGYLSFASMHFTDSACKTQGTDTARRVEVSVGATGALELFAVGLGAECNTSAGNDTASTYASVTFTDASTARWTVVTLRAATAPCAGKSSGSSITLMLGDAIVACASVAVDPMQKLDAFALALGISDGKPWGDTTLDFDDVEVTVE